MTAVAILTVSGAAAAASPAEPGPCDCAMAAQADANRKSLRRLYTEVLAQWNDPVIDELIAPDFVDHVMPADHPKGPKGFRKLYAGMRAAFPDLQYKIEDLLADGDKAVVRWSWTGTHRGTYMGVPATGRQVPWAGVAIYRLVNGKAVERWVTVNQLDLARKLGRDLTSAPQAK